MPQPNPVACIHQKSRNKIVNPTKVQQLEKLVNDLKAGNPSASDVAVAQKALDAYKRALAQKKFKIAKQILAITRADERVKDARSKGRVVVAAPHAAMGRDVGSTDNFFKGGSQILTGENSEAVANALNDQSVGLLYSKLDVAGALEIGNKIKPEDADEIINILYNEPLSDPNKKAIQNYAEGFKLANNNLFSELGKTGVPINRRLEWNAPQHHDPLRTSQTPKAQWIAEHSVWYDKSKTIDHETGAPVDNVKWQRLLSDAYDTIKSDGWNKVDKGGKGTSMAARYSAEREFQFVNAQAWKDHHAKYSGRSTMEILLGHLQQRARDIGVFKVFGPNPDATMRHYERLAMLDAQDRGMHPEAQLQKLWWDFDTLTGRLDSPRSPGMANAGGTMRNWLSGSQLGSAVVSAIFTDPVNTAVARGMNGLTFKSPLEPYISGSFTRDKLEAAHFGAGVDDWLDAFHGLNRMGQDFEGNRVSRWMSRATMRLSGLAQMTSAGRAHFKMSLLRAYGGHLEAKTPWADLPEYTRLQLERRNVTEKDWRALDSIVLARDTRYNLPTLNLFDVAKVNPETAAKISQVLNEEVEFAVPTGSNRVRSQLRFGTQVGTPAGEVARFTAMYKSYPMMVVHTHIMRLMTDPAFRNLAGAQMSAQFFVMTTLLGAMAMQSKAVIAGRNPAPLTTDPAQMSKFWLAAMLQGGAMGPFGDLLFQDTTRFGQSFLVSAMGPGAGVVNDLYDLTGGNINKAIRGKDTDVARDLTNLGRRYTPILGTNLYTRLLFNRLVMDQLQMLADPGAAASFRQKENKLKQDFGSNSWWPSGQVRPRSLPLE